MKDRIEVDDDGTIYSVRVKFRHSELAEYFEGHYSSDFKRQVIDQVATAVSQDIIKTRMNEIAGLIKSEEVANLATLRTLEKMVPSYQP